MQKTVVKPAWQTIRKFFVPYSIMVLTAPVVLILAALCAKPGYYLYRELEYKYGHPTEEALAAYAEVGAAVYRTDELGTLIFVADGKEIVKK